MALILSDVIRQIDNLSDESPDQDMVVDWINDALAEIGVEVKATFPEMSVSSLSATFPFADKWVRNMIIPYAAGRATQKEASQFQYRDYYGQFLTNLEKFVAQYTVPDIYKDADLNESQTSDIFTNPTFPFGGKF